MRPWHLLSPALAVLVITGCSNTLPIGLGDKPDAVITQIVPLTAAATFPATTKLTLGCAHQHVVASPMFAVHTTLRATRVVSVGQQ